jgi:hypothetical protein
VIHSAPLSGEVLPPPVDTVNVPVWLLRAALRDVPDMKSQHLLSLARLAKEGRK